MHSGMKAVGLLSALLLAGCSGTGGTPYPTDASSSVGPVKDAEPGLSRRQGHALEEQAYAALAQGRREEARGLFQRAAEGGFNRAWLALGALALPSDTASAAEALAHYRLGTVAPEDALWLASLEQQLSLSQERQRHAAELQRLKAELQKKESAIRRLRELTLGR